MSFEMIGDLVSDHDPSQYLDSDVSRGAYSREPDFGDFRRELSQTQIQMEEAKAELRSNPARFPTSSEQLTRNAAGDLVISREAYNAGVDQWVSNWSEEVARSTEEVNDVIVELDRLLNDPDVSSADRVRIEACKEELENRLKFLSERTAALQDAAEELRTTGDSDKMEALERKMQGIVSQIEGTKSRMATTMAKAWDVEPSTVVRR